MYSGRRSADSTEPDAPCPDASSPSRTSRSISLSPVSLLIGLLILALCGLEVTGGSSQQFVVFLADTSRSVPEGAATAEGKFLDQAIAQVLDTTSDSPIEAKHIRLLTHLYRKKIQLLWRVSRVSS